MKTHFGPWTTAIDTGSTAQLSAFWKRRMAMLPKIGSSPRRFSRRAVLMLVSLTAVALFLPNLKTAPNSLATAGDNTQVDNSRMDATPAIEYFPRPSEAEKKIEAALNAPVSVEFNDTPLTEALEFLHKRTGVNLFLDKKALAEEGVKSGEKMFLRAKDVPLRHVLRMTLSQANLKFVVIDDVLKVTTHAEADQRQITRTYPVADLITTDMGPDFDSLTQMLTSIVDPTTWDENGGPAAVQPSFDSKSVVISQTYANHEQVLSLLRSLRAAKAKQSEGKKSAATPPANRKAAREFRIRLNAAGDGELASVQIDDRTVKSIADLEKEFRALAAGKNAAEPIAGDAEVEFYVAPKLRYTVVRDAITAIQSAFAPKQVKIKFKDLSEEGGREPAKR